MAVYRPQGLPGGRGAEQVRWGRGRVTPWGNAGRGEGAQRQGAGRSPGTGCSWLQRRPDGGRTPKLPSLGGSKARGPSRPVRGPWAGHQDVTKGVVTRPRHGPCSLWAERLLPGAPAGAPNPWGLLRAGASRPSWGSRPRGLTPTLMGHQQTHRPPSGASVVGDQQGPFSVSQTLVSRPGGPWNLRP